MLIVIFFLLGFIHPPNYSLNYYKEPSLTKEYLQSLKPDKFDRFLGKTNSKYKIVEYKGWLWADIKATDLASKKTNEALIFIEDEDYERAKEILELVRKKSPQFFPARYNLGKIYMIFKDHQRALLEFKKATQIVRNYWKNYLNIGEAYEMAGDFDFALEYYKRAYRRNPFQLEPLIAIGDLLLKNKRLEEAKVMYKYCLTRDHGYNNALIGLGKIEYFQKNFYNALVWFRGVSTNHYFNKEYYYYYGEAAFYSKAYPLAVKKFKLMLTYPQDIIFNKISLSRLRQRLEQAEKLSLQKASED